MASTYTAKQKRRRARKRQKFFIAQGGKCWLCGGPMTLNSPDRLRDPLAATWDHVTPKAHGGPGTQDNLMLAHKKCNGERGDRADVRALDRI